MILCKKIYGNFVTIREKLCKIIDKHHFSRCVIITRLKSAYYNARITKMKNFFIYYFVCFHKAFYNLSDKFFSKAYFSKNAIKV